MHLRATRRLALAGTGRICITLATLTLALVAAPAAHADDGGDFCPPTVNGSMSMAPGNAGMCIHGVGSHYVTIAHGWRQNNQSAEHCVGVHDAYSPTASHVIGYSCGIGSSPDGHRATDYVGSGRRGYPIHKNNASVTLSGFAGAFSFVSGTRAAPSEESSRADTTWEAERGGTISAELREEFGVLRRPRGSDDGLGEHAVGPALDEIYVDQTRSIEPAAPVDGAARAADDYEVWVAGGQNDGICLLTMAASSDGPNSQCLTRDIVAEGKQLSVTEWSATDLFAAGVVPDGVSTVVLGLKDGRSLALPVQDNVYRARLDSDVRSVSFTPEGGSPVFYVPDHT